MEFRIQNNGLSLKKELSYLNDEYSFYMGPIKEKVDFELIINKISLVVSGQKVVHVSGFCGFKQNQETCLNLPEHKKGALIVETDLEPGFAYDVYEEEVDIFIDFDQNVVCLGDHLAEGEGVEFIDNCIAIIRDGTLLSLWLKTNKSLYGRFDT